MSGRRTFICEEIAMQLLALHYPHKMLEGEWNCSPAHGHEKIEEGKVKIYHFHGEKHVRKDAFRAVWLPAYIECLENNAGGICEWTPAGDPDLTMQKFDEKLTGDERALLPLLSGYHEKHSKLVSP